MIPEGIITKSMKVDSTYLSKQRFSHAKNVATVVKRDDKFLGFRLCKN